MSSEGTNSNGDGGGINAPSVRPEASQLEARAAAAPTFYLIVALFGGLIGGALTNRLAAAIPALAAETPAKSLAAQQILLVDARGNPHASLHLNDDGLPVFQMLDLAGRDRIAIGFAKDGTAGLAIADQKGTERIFLSLSDDGVPALRLYDNGARPRLLLGVDNQGNSAMDFYESDGKLLRELP